MSLAAGKYLFVPWARKTMRETSNYGDWEKGRRDGRAVSKLPSRYGVVIMIRENYMPRAGDVYRTCLPNAVA